MADKSFGGKMNKFVSEAERVAAKVEEKSSEAAQAVKAEAGKVEAKVENEIKYVEMFRHKGPPHKAVVHPAEVHNYAKGGWMTREQFEAEKK